MQYLRHPEWFGVSTILLNFVIWPIAGILWGIMTWNLVERGYPLTYGATQRSSCRCVVCGL